MVLDGCDEWFEPCPLLDLEEEPEAISVCSEIMPVLFESSMLSTIELKLSRLMVVSTVARLAGLPWEAEDNVPVLSDNSVGAQLMIPVRSESSMTSFSRSVVVFDLGV